MDNTECPHCGGSLWQDAQSHAWPHVQTSYDRERAYVCSSAVVLVFDLCLMALMSAGIDIGWGLLAAACISNATLLLCWLVYAHKNTVALYAVYIAYIALVLYALWSKIKCEAVSVTM